MGYTTTEAKKPTTIDKIGPSGNDEEIEWLDVEEPLDLVDTSEESRSELSSEGHDLLSSRIILSEDDYDRGCRKPSDLEDRFYRDTIKFGPEYVTGIADEGEVTNFFKENENKVLSESGDGVRIYPDGVVNPSTGNFLNFQGRIDVIDAIDADEEITLVSAHAVNVLDDVEMFVEEQDVVVKKVNDEVNVVEEVVEAINSAKLIVDVAQVSAASVQVSAASAATTTVGTSTNVEDITLAQALEEMKRTKPKLKGVVIQEKEQGISTRTTISSQQTQSKGKAIMIELEKPLKEKDQIRLNEETALMLQAEFDEEERLAREEAKKAKIDVDHQLAERYYFQLLLLQVFLLHQIQLVTLNQFLHQA
ncbi:hypothetical protein Tco_0349546 [Tanacetum coccineum]